MTESSQQSRWIAPVLRAAAVYNLLWCASAIFFPDAMFRWLGIQAPHELWLWQGIGMLVGVYGIGFWLAAKAPFQHWLIVFLGLLSKVLGPIGVMYAALQNEVPWTLVLLLIPNDLIWWWPFAAILFQAYRSHSDSATAAEGFDFQRAIRTIPSHRGATLFRLSQELPTVVVFLRHAGCTFCREALQDLADLQQHIDLARLHVALVHMSSPLQGTLLMQKYGLEGVHRFSDPQCVLYRAFGVPRGRWWQLMSPYVIVRGLVAALWKGHGFGRIQGDGFRLPGLFILHNGEIIERTHFKTAADRPDYVALARRVLEISTPSSRQHLGTEMPILTKLSG